MHKPTHGPYTLGGTLPVVIDGVERAPSRLLRDNDGTIGIMAPDQSEGSTPEDRRRIGGVNTILPRKRGSSWDMALGDDPEQAANARLFREAWALYEFAVQVASATSGPLQQHAAALVALVDGTD